MYIRWAQLSYACTYERPTNHFIMFAARGVLSIINVSKDQMYGLKLKGISICFAMLKAALCGNYVNFGVFRLYGDDALDNALNSFVKLLLSIPQSDLLVCTLSIMCNWNVNMWQLLLAHRTTLNYLRPTLFSWSAWRRITWVFWPPWSLTCSSTFFPPSLMGL